MGKIKMKEVLAIISDNFTKGKPFLAKEIKELLDNSRSTSYFLKTLKEQGLLQKLARNRWVLPESAPEFLGPELKEGAEVQEEEPQVSLRISLKEKEIFQEIFNMDLKSKGGKSRFGLDHLKDRLSKEQQLLLPELLPKLKSVGMIHCLGEGAGKGKVMEMDDSIFLKYFSGEGLEISPFSNTELDERINSFISQVKKEKGKREELISEFNYQELELHSISGQISILENSKKEIEKKLAELKAAISSTQEFEKYPGDLIESLARMPIEHRRAFFQKVLD